MSKDLNEEHDVFDCLDDVLGTFEGVTVEGGADPAAEEDNCLGGGCKL